MRRPASPADRGELVRYVQKLLVTLAFGALAVVAWRWSHVLLLAFGAVLAAVLFRAIADPIRDRTPLDAGGSLALAVVVVIGVVLATLWFAGAQVWSQFDVLREVLPRAWAAVQARLAEFEAGRRLLAELQAAGQEPGVVARFGGILGRLGRATTLAVGALADLLLVVVAGLYLAAAPARYRDGALGLLPASARGAVAETFEETARALRRWLLGTGAAMVAMGVMVAVGTALLGLPSPLALGLLAGLAEFVPILGAVLSAVPGLLVALAIGPQAALSTLVLYVGLHQVEGQLVIPLVQGRAVSLPPALIVFALLAFGLLFGPLGVMFATPLTVVLSVFVRKLYVERMLASADDGPAG
jgi:predicted PurR-regulated permease PerM